MNKAPSLTVRLALLFAAVSATVLLTIGTVVGYLVEEHFEMLDMVELSGKLTLIEHVLAKPGVAARSDELARQLNEALVGHHGLTVAVYTGQGDILYTSGNGEFPAQVLQGSLLARPLHPVIWEHQGRSFRGIATSTPEVGKVPAHSVAVALDMAHHQEFMSAFRRMLWAALALGIVLSSLLGWLAARRGLAPVRAMAGIARSISAERLDARLPLQSVPLEVQDLASSFNAMLARLEDSFKRLSEFSSDIAHELRTPVSNLMTQTQVAVSKARSADEYREILYSNLEEYDRLARMIADMLLLAKTDNPLLTLRRDDIDLGTEIDQLLDFYQALADEQGVHVARHGDGRIVGDASMIRRALSNLLSNAIRHTPRGGSVSISVNNDEPALALQNQRLALSQIRVENTGDTIPAEHLPRLFDRFYRVDPARSRGSDGAGLGLAIVKAIVAVHAGHIEVSSADGVTSFVMSLPAA